MSLSLTYPGGKLLTVPIAATTGNVVTNKSPGSLKRWLILYGSIACTADANAANRRIQMELTNGTVIIFQFGDTDVFTASQTANIHYGNIGAETAMVLGRSATLRGTIEVGPGFILEGDDQLRFTIQNGLVGDNYEGYMRVLELGITP